VNITQLIAAVKKAAPFVLPEMDEGTGYLYDNIYSRLSRGEAVLFSGMDFDAFDSEDIRSLCEIYDNVFEKNNYQAGGIVRTLRQVDPVCKAAVYI